MMAFLVERQAFDRNRPDLRKSRLEYTD